jgi:hypothetical protein
MKKIRVAMMHHNLNQITGFHNHIHGFFNDNLKKSGDSEEIDNHQKNWLKQEYSVHLPNQLRKSVFLMMFGHLEENLCLTWMQAGKPDCLDHNQNGIKKYKKFFTKHLNFELQNDSSYQYIVNCQVIRNSIIHSAGRISLMKNQDKVKSIIEKSAGCFEENIDRVSITNDGISKFQKCVATFTEKVAVAI